MHLFSAGAFSLRRCLAYTTRAPCGSTYQKKLCDLRSQMLDFASHIKDTRSSSHHTFRMLSTPASNTMRQDGFGVVRIGSQQYKVFCGDLIFVERLAHYNVGDEVLLRDVMMFSSKDLTLIGRPTLKKAAFHATVEEHFREMRVPVHKQKRRKSSQRTTSERQVMTGLRIHGFALEGNPFLQATGT
mmetsp:Transcript_7813/g.31649  ORF Transcript_7813/g.31649 Transcript_7813/m.31649 type:complete len:186 (+) Transcript_7813:61-618(+)